MMQDEPSRGHSHCWLLGTSFITVFGGRYERKKNVASDDVVGLLTVQLTEQCSDSNANMHSFVHPLRTLLDVLLSGGDMSLWRRYKKGLESVRYKH